MNTHNDLAAINQKILADGESLPLVQLKDGSKVQTGTVATMLRNIELYNAGERGASSSNWKLPSRLSPRLACSSCFRRKSGLQVTTQAAAWLAPSQPSILPLSS